MYYTYVDNLHTYIGFMYIVFVSLDTISSKEKLIIENININHFFTNQLLIFL